MDKVPAPSFHHRVYGVDVTWLGENEGGMAARGHVPDRRFVAACNHLARNEAGVVNIFCDRSATLDEVLSVVKRVWAVTNEGPGLGSEFEWAVTWHKVTEQTPGALPLTVLMF